VVERDPFGVASLCARREKIYSRVRHRRIGAAAEDTNLSSTDDVTFFVLPQSEHFQRFSDT
jgi:hypothetical protein